MSSTIMELNKKIVMAYLRSNGSFSGRKAVQLLSCTESETLKIEGIEELEQRKARRITYEHPLSFTMLLTFVFDAALHEGALGIINTPFLVFKRVTASRELVDVEVDDVPFIHTIISEIEDEQNIIDPLRTNNIIMAYYVAAGKKSGLLPIVIAVSNNENFQIPARHLLMNNAPADGLDILDNCHPAHHTLLVSAVLLECATVLFLSTDATLDVALQEAYSRLTSSYPALQAQLYSLSQDCTKEDYIAFVLKHKLTISQ
ncbi:hypothetical protein L210DRAFT_3641438 [Boletus edulis BED1]|uniref:Uncharacterized protein n=1 Tax=Boletus edulis BED1 TaxID=1328754 RepID=A0AAD4GJD4_BOLED|nr:hypothetical protein L210DRAFT_3641438 [Boletus edulis BED1]